MKHIRFTSKCVLLLAVLFFAANTCLAQDEGGTEITGFYQQYRQFSFNTGVPNVVIPETELSGGGFGIAHDFVPWFALWTQFSFYGSCCQ